MSHKYYHTVKTKHAVFSWELKICILQISMHVWIKFTKKQRNSKFSWELEQKC